MATTSSVSEDEKVYGREEVEPESEYAVFLRYPILYENAVQDDDFNGLGALSDTLSCQVVRTANEFPTLQLVYKRDGVHAQELQEGRIIMEDMGPDFVHQKFRINQVTKTQENITVNATHIAGDIAYNTITKDIQLPSASPEDVFGEIQGSLADPMPALRFDSDVSALSNVNMQMSDGNAGNLLISPDQEGDQPTESISGLFKGEWQFDDYHYYFNQQGGKDTGIVIKYGRNLKTVNQDTNIANTYTAGFFYAKYTPAPPQATDQSEDWATIGANGLRDVATTTYAAGGIVDIYSSPVQGHTIVGQITNGTQIQVCHKITDGETLPDKHVVNTVNGDDWYYVLNKGWIDAKWLTFDKSGDYLINKAVGHQTVTMTDANGKQTKYPFSGVGIISDPDASGARCFYDPFFGKAHNPNGIKIPNGTPVHFDYKAINQKGDVWYRITPGSYKVKNLTKSKKKIPYITLDGHCWIYGPHVSFTKDGAYTEAPTVNGVGYVKSNSQKYVMKKTSNGGYKMVTAPSQVKLEQTRTKKTKKYKTKITKRKSHGITTRHKSTVINPAWTKEKKVHVKTTVKKGYVKLRGQIEIDGVTYYKTGNGTYVKSSSMDWKKDMSHKPKTIDQVAKSKISLGKIEMYAEPRFGTAINWAIPNGVSLATGNTAHGDGEDWTYVEYNGKQGWVLSKYLKTKGDADFDSYNPDDVESSDDTQSTNDSNVDVQDLTVTLPEGTLYADSAYNEEVARVQNVDLSSYFQHDYQDDSGLDQKTGQYHITQKDVEQLRELAQDYMREYKFGQPDISLTLTAEQISDYGLDNVNLYDRVMVDFQQIGIEETSEVNSTTWDAMAHRYIETTIGKLPVTYEHALLNAANKKANSNLASATAHTRAIGKSLLGRYHQALAQEGTDRAQAIQNLKDEMGLHVTEINKKTDQIIQDWQVSNKQFTTQMDKIDSDTNAIKSWIDAGGTDIIHADPDWANPKQLWAKSDAGGRMVFNNHGLEYTDDSGNTLRSAISSDGHIYAEAIDAGTISAVEINSALITGAFHFHQSGIDTYIGGYYNATPLGDRDESATVSNSAIMVTSPNYTTAISSGGVYVTSLDMEHFGRDYTKGIGIQNNGSSIHPTYMSVSMDSNHVLTMANFASHAYSTIKSWVRSWVADYITVKGTQHWIWKGVDPTNATTQFLP